MALRPKVRPNVVITFEQASRNICLLPCPWISNNSLKSFHSLNVVSKNIKPRVHQS